MKKVAILKRFKHLLVTNGTVQIESVRKKVKVHVEQEEVKTDTEVNGGLNEQRNIPYSRIDVLRGGGAEGERGINGRTRKLLNSAPMLAESRRRLPWEKLHLFPEQNSSLDTVVMDTYNATRAFRTRKLLDEDYFANSLRHVNKLFTRRYGHDARKVPAHMPHFIQRPVMVSLQDDMWEHYDRTSSHQVRASNDMQFAFSYFYYLMSEKQDMDLKDAYRQLDTDKTGSVQIRCLIMNRSWSVQCRYFILLTSVSVYMCI